MQETYKIGNAQTIGARQIQSSYFASGYRTGDPDAAMAVLSDGTIDHINGRRCAVLAVEACMREFINMTEKEELPAFFETAAGKVLREMHELIYLGRQPYLSLSILVIRFRELFYYNVGSSRMFLFDGMDLKFLPGQSGQTGFTKGMTAGLVSRGIWEALNEKEMVSYLTGRRHPYEKAQQMLAGVKEKNRKQAGNAAVVLVGNSSGRYLHTAANTVRT